MWSCGTSPGLLCPILIAWLSDLARWSSWSWSRCLKQTFQSRLDQRTCMSFSPDSILEEWDLDFHEGIMIRKKRDSSFYTFHSLSDLSQNSFSNPFSSISLGQWLTDGRHVTGREVVLWEAQEDATLAHGGVPYDNQLDQMVVLLLAPWCIHFFFYNSKLYNYV